MASEASHDPQPPRRPRFHASSWPSESSPASARLWLNPARAAVGPLPPEALVLPADARFVMGFDVKRFTASPFYARYASQRGMQPEALRELEEKTGLNPERDVDQIVVAGGERRRSGSPGLALALGRFDLYKHRPGAGDRGQGDRPQRTTASTVYVFKEEDQRARGPWPSSTRRRSSSGRGPRSRRRSRSRTRGETPFKKNAALIGARREGAARVHVLDGGGPEPARGMPTPSPPRARPADGGHVSLPALKSLTVTGDLDPQVSLDRHRRGDGRARGEEPGRRGARLRRAHEPAGAAEAGAGAARLRPSPSPPRPTGCSSPPASPTSCSTPSSAKAAQAASTPALAVPA